MKDFEDSGGSSTDPQARARAVARLSTLQRLRDDALANNRRAMLETIEAMIASELRVLTGRHAADPEPHA